MKLSGPAAAALAVHSLGRACRAGRCCCSLVAGVLVAVGGFVGLAAAAFVRARCCAAFMFSGLCLLHDLSRGRPWRLPMLISVYVSLVVMQAVLTPLLALVGLVDTAFGLRKRRARLPPAPTQS